MKGGTSYKQNIPRYAVLCDVLAFVLWEKYFTVDDVSVFNLYSFIVFLFSPNLYYIYVFLKKN